jgi:hypothetical protein
MKNNCATSWLFTEIIPRCGTVNRTKNSFNYFVALNQMFELRSTQGTVTALVWVMLTTISKFFWTSRKKTPGRISSYKLVVGTDSDRLPPRQYALPAPFGKFFKKWKYKRTCIVDIRVVMKLISGKNTSLLWSDMEKNIAFLRRLTKRSISSTETLGFWSVGSKQTTYRVTKLLRLLHFDTVVYDVTYLKKVKW